MTWYQLRLKENDTNQAWLNAQCFSPGSGMPKSRNSESGSQSPLLVKEENMTAQWFYDLGFTYTGTEDSRVDMSMLKDAWYRIDCIGYLDYTVTPLKAGNALSFTAGARAWEDGTKTQA